MMINEVDGGGRMMALFMIDGAKKKKFIELYVSKKNNQVFFWKIPEEASVGVQLPVDFRYRKDFEKLT